MTNNRQWRAARVEKMRKEHDEFMGHRNPGNDWFFDQFDSKFDKTMSRAFKWAPIIWIVGFILSAAASIAFIAAMVALVVHFT